MTLEAESRLNEAPVERIEQMEQKSIHQRDDSKQLETIFKAPDAWTLQS
jgi:hypothetical protein